MEKQDEENMFDPNSNQPPTTCKMFKVFLRIAIPAIFTNFMSLASCVTNAVYAGRMNDPVKLAVVGISATVCTLMVQSFMVGLSSAQETLTSQAYGA